MMNDAQIINKLGGATKVAQKLPVSRQAVVNWKKIGISAQFRPAVYEMAERAGFAAKINKQKFYGYWPIAAE